MKTLAASWVVLGAMTLANVALADDSEQASQRNVITTPIVEITSHVMRPQAAIAVARMNPTLTLVEMKQLFIDRIEQSLFGGAF